MYIGRFLIGTLVAMITIAPEAIPAVPIPAIALPMMKLVELGAAPQTAEPSSNTTRAGRKTHFEE